MQEKINYVANIRFPTEKAHGLQIAKMCEAFIHSGTDVTLIVPRRKNKVKDDPFKYYDIQTRFKVKKLWTINIVQHTYLGFVFSSLIFGISSYIYLLCQRDKYVIYSMDIDPISFIFLPLLERPIFFDIHGPKRRTWPYKWLMKHISGVITINDFTKNQLVRAFNRLENRIIVFPNGVNLERTFSGRRKDARKHLGLSEDGKIVFYGGSFQDWKGLDTIIKVAQKKKEVKFYFAGGTKNELEDIKGFNVEIPDNINFLGQINISEIPVWSKAADVVLVTGTKRNEYSYKYTSPMKLFVSMNYKTPIVVSRTPAIEQIVTNEEVFFHNPDDEDDLENTISEVMNNKQEAARRAKNAYEKVKEFSWENRAQHAINFFEDKI
ncbi:MAG: glycosyltransferase family 4 protein [Candidatus Pacebacteria bacterium]|jgi:glycosyltransferase involved in cell wall biosynthesis|nr:glycosyltransferase family 4 protein [Candidatus Paceibacterota bacterium]|tara:strand:- start:6567 stop:7703 length:1137 start_codon:yes stop_codon:yes gene_type:complete